MKDYKQRLGSLAATLIQQHNDSKVYNFLSFIHTSDVVVRYMETQFRMSGLDRTKLGILHFLLANGGTMTPTELSNCTFRTKDAITKAVDNLDRLGLTRSTKPKSDRRLRKVTITEKGLELMEKILPVRRQAFAQAMQCLNQKDAKVLRSILKDLRAHLFNLIENSETRVKKHPEEISSLLSLLKNNP